MSPFLTLLRNATMSQDIQTISAPRARGPAHHDDVGSSPQRGENPLGRATARPADRMAGRPAAVDRGSRLPAGGQRGFAPGRELEDWLAAEIEIDALFDDSPEPPWGVWSTVVASARR
jgi:hypothetical protein